MLQRQVNLDSNSCHETHLRHAVACHFTDWVCEGICATRGNVPDPLPRRGQIALKKPVTIYNEEQLASFLQFLRTENLSRCRFLRQLDLWALEPESEHVQELIDVGAPIRSSPARQRPVLYPYVIISAQTPADPYFLVLHMFFTCLILRSIPLLCHTPPHVTDFIHFHQRLCHAVQYSFLFRYPPVQPYRSCFVLYLTCICHLYCALGLSLPSVLHSRLHMPY